jgi:hypothetical protein
MVEMYEYIYKKVGKILTTSGGNSINQLVNRCAHIGQMAKLRKEILPTKNRRLCQPIGGIFIDQWGKILRQHVSQQASFLPERKLYRQYSKRWSDKELNRVN